MTYTAPIEDFGFLINHVLDVDDLLALTAFKEFDSDLFNAVLEEAGKFASSTLAPLNKQGDEQGCTIDAQGNVITPEGFKQAYTKFTQNGWNAVPFPAQYGGQGLPWLISTAISECWSGANMAWALCPLLTQGAVELLLHHGTEPQKNAYLSKLISGEWTGTMCLTEPQAGSDVGAVSTRAIKESEHYRITGQKIFITFGEHDYTDNIVHMVLARLPDAPTGTKGISLFLVPKFLDDGSHNNVKALSIEHKMGIHGSPTAIMEFDGAQGYVIGEENRGLNCMFTMMNNARLAVGVEGVAIAENSLQKARAYAAQRVQMGASIDQHPDVKRMLTHIQAHTMATRSLALLEAKSLDMAAHHADTATKKQHAALAAFLTPIVKAHSTDIGFDTASMAVQIFGGTGFIKETGIEQNVRDAKIAQIYEGTNGIQAIDFLMRKLAVEGVAEYFINDLNAINSLKDTADLLDKTTHHTRNILKADKDKALFNAMHTLTLWGIALGGYMMERRKKALLSADGISNSFKAQASDAIDYYQRYILIETKTLAEVILRG